MRKLSLVLLGWLVFNIAGAQSVEVIKKDKLLQLLQPDSGLFVINFWATWCKPCMEEMPLFAKADSMYNSRVNFIFVSFDYAEDSASVNRKIKSQKIPGRQFLIDETDMDMLINAVDPDWSGALPATWFVKQNFKKAAHSNFSHFDDIQNKIDELIAPPHE
jgi:thiol-disulfide isomerase/thioredoxin